MKTAGDGTGVAAERAAGGEGTTARHTRYQQSFRGVPIFGEQVVVSEDAGGNVRPLFGRIVTDLAAELPATAPRMAKAQALVIARRATLGNEDRYLEHHVLIA